MKIKITPRKKLMIFKILLFLFAFIVAVMPATVSRSREVNSRVIVEMIGIDCGDKVTVTAQYVMPTETEGATSKDKVTVDGKTLTEAVELLSTALGRRAELGHCSLVILGKDADSKTLAALMTATDVTADVYLAAAEDKAKDLVGDLTDFMKKTGATDADFIAYSAKKSHIATTTLLSFLSDVGSASNTAYVPLVQMIEEQPSGGGESSGSGESGGSGGSGGGSSGGGESSGGSGGGSGSSGSSNSSGGGGSSGGSGGKESMGMTVEKLALYGEDGRRGILETSAARGVAWVSAPVEKGVVTADVTVDGETVRNVSAILLKKSSSVKIDAENKIANIKVKATIAPKGDCFNSIISKKSDEVTAAVKAGFADSIKKEVTAGFADAVACNSDPLFLVRQFYRFKPSVVENGLTVYDISVNVDVEVTLK